MSDAGYAKKCVLYVGGLDSKVDEGMLLNAFVPFGDIVSVMIPREAETTQHRAFGYVEFEEPVRKMEDGGMEEDVREWSERGGFRRTLKRPSAICTRRSSSAVFSRSTWHSQQRTVEELVRMNLFANGILMLMIALCRLVWMEADQWYKTALKEDGNAVDEPMKNSK